MKRLKRIGSYYTGRKLQVLFIAVLFTVLLLFLVLRLGGVAPYLESLRLYRHADLDGSVYYMPSRVLETNEPEDDTEEILQYSAVKDIVTQQVEWMYRGDDENAVANVFFYGDAMLDAFHLPTEGKWLTDLTEEDEKEICVVVCGYWFQDVKVGETMELGELEGTGEIVSVRVVGKRNAFHVVLPIFGISSRNVNTEQISHISNNSIIVRQKDAVRLLGHEPSFQSYGSFIRLKEMATGREVEELQDFLSLHGGYNTYEDILKETQLRCRDVLLFELALPVILLSIALYAFTAVFVWIIGRRKTAPMPAHFQSGHSKQRYFVDFFLSMLFVLLIPCIPSVLLVLQIPAELTEWFLILMWGSTDGKMLGVSLLPYLSCYLLVGIAVSVMLSIQFVRKLQAVADE